MCRGKTPTAPPRDVRPQQILAAREREREREKEGGREGGGEGERLYKQCGNNVHDGGVQGAAG